MVSIPIYFNTESGNGLVPSGNKPLPEPMLNREFLCQSIPLMIGHVALGANVSAIRFVKGIKNGCPCIVEIRGTQGCALVGDPARAVGECRDVAKAQP